MIALLGSLFAGCSSGPTLVPVSGHVEFAKDGSPAQFGSVEFRSENDPNPIARGKIQEDGSFKLKTGGKAGAIKGWHSVVIVQVAGNARGGKVKHNHGLDVSKKYLDHRTTDLRIEITPESANNLILRVEDEDAKR